LDCELRTAPRLRASGDFMLLSPSAMAQQWNEIPAPTGKEADSRTYGVAYRTDVIDCVCAAMAAGWNT
jgi:hypothetical protein